jgi:hypothetical protein
MLYVDWSLMAKLSDNFGLAHPSKKNRNKSTNGVS